MVSENDDCGLLDLSCLYANVYFRHFINDGPLQGEIEDKIFWDTSIDTKISQFDGVRFILGKEYPFRKLNLFPTTAIWAEYRTGIDDAFKYSSWTLNLRKEVKVLGLKLPLYFRYFDGYGNEISSYHLRDEYLVFGLQFR